jgi:hypothetical protein
MTKPKYEIWVNGKLRAACQTLQGAKDFAAIEQERDAEAHIVIRSFRRRRGA